jgi:uncharacterized protein YwgA
MGDARDLVLAIVDSRNGILKGRTILQKLSFFVDDRLNIGIRFKPHFYGPYSEDIAEATASLVALDFLTETSEVIPLASSQDPTFDSRVYTYALTKAGRELIKERRKHVSLYKEVKEVVSQLEESGLKTWDAGSLSAAAKIVFILKTRERRELGNEEIARYANFLGWKLSKERVDELSKYLEKAGLIASANS